MDNLYLRKANAEDVDILFLWANDALCRENSFQIQAIPYDEHRGWFDKIMTSNDSELFIYCRENVPIGQLRFDYRKGDAILSYSIAKEFRGFGYARRLLELAESRIKEGTSEIQNIVGYVKKNNDISKSKFEMLEYQCVEEESCFKYYKPIKGLISICLIMRDEEKNLDKCLSKLTPYGYEIIIVDTGSIDKSREIAKKYTDRVYNYQWAQDFAAAKNYSISKATNEYVMIIDCDEFVTEFNKAELELLIKENPDAIGRLTRINEFTREKDLRRGYERVSRLFRKSIYHYEGIVHEQIISKSGMKSKFYDIPIEILHTGYEGDISVRTKKTERNIELLKKQLDDYGKEPYVLYQLGKSYYMQTNYKVAAEYFGEALFFDLDTKLEFVQDLVECYGYSLIESEQFETAMLLLNVYDEFAGSTDFVFLAGLIYMNNGKFQEAIKEFLKASEMKRCKIEGVNSYRAFYNIGVIYECLGDLKNAQKYYKKCENYVPAIERSFIIKKGGN